tara:strand:+ start:176 stop:757 length:582 start_codon:yes stop_codon:yes gene_type:complete
MIDITFIHNFFWEGFPSNKDELLDFIENEKEDKNQAFAWSEECSIEVKGIKIENNTIQKFLPLLRTFFKEIEATKNIELKLKELWVNTYKRHFFQEIHDHFPSHLSGVIFLTDEKEGDAKFYFANKDFSQVQKPLYDVVDLNNNMFAPRRYIKAERGKVLLFPSYLLHGVTVHKSDYPRKTASFNLDIVNAVK